MTETQKALNTLLSEWGWASVEAADCAEGNLLRRAIAIGRAEGRAEAFAEVRTFWDAEIVAHPGERLKQYDAVWVWLTEEMAP